MKICISLLKNNMRHLFSFVFCVVFLLLAFQSTAQFYDPSKTEDEDEKEQDEPQNEKSKPEKDFLEKVYVGGNIGLQFGTSFALVEVSPLAGYHIAGDLSAGIGATYQFRRFLGSSDHVYGGRVFARYDIANIFFATAEYEAMRWEVPTEGSQWVPGVFVGGGIFFSKSDRGGAYLSVLYNLEFDELRSPYNNEWVIRPGFIFYLR